MKDLYSNWLMKWMLKKGIPAHKAYDYIGILGGGRFWVALLPSIVVQHIEVSGLIGTVLYVLMMLVTICLFVISGYCLYLENSIWLMLLNFGSCDIIMGLAIDFGVAWRIVFTVLGVLITGIGTYLTPKQLRNSSNLKPELEASRRRWKLERSARPRKKQTPPAARDTGPKPQSSQIDQLKLHLCNAKYMMKIVPKEAEPERFEAAERDYAAAAKKLGEKLLEQSELWVLVCKFRGVQPVYMGTDGRMELFTSCALAEAGQKALLELINVETDIRTISGSDAIRSFFADCAHRGFQVLRLDNGGRNACELWLKDFFPYREDNLIDEKKRSLRQMLHRAKLYSWLLARQKDQNSSQGYSLAEMMLTMRLNGYRELGSTVVYALGNPMPEDRLYATQAAMDKVREWLPGSGYERSGIEGSGTYDAKLQLFFVNHPGQQGDVEKGMVCIFTDVAQAKATRAMFRGSNMDPSVVAVTFEELISQAVQCAGIVVDMNTLSFEIPKEEYVKINEVRKLDAGILVNLKRPENGKNIPSGPQESAAQVYAQQTSPQLKHTEMRGAWKQFDYQWPQRFGYDYMLQNAHWLITHDLPAQTLTTAQIAGAPEQEHIQELKDCGGRPADCVGRETGVLAVGGFSKSTGCLMKVYWYNQTNVVRIFTAGEAEQEKINAFADMLFEAKEGDCR